MKQKRCSRNNNTGFTLIELLIVMAIFMIVVGAMYGVFESSNRSHAIQNEVVDAQNNLRAAVGLLSRELKMAGYNNAISFVTQPATPDEANPLRFNTDIGLVEYQLSSKNLQRKSPGGLNFETIAENIIVFNFRLTGNKATFIVEAETASGGRERTASVTVQVRNM